MERSQVPVYETMENARSGPGLAGYGVATARVLLELIFVFFGLNGFLQFLPAPQSIPGAQVLAGLFFAPLLERKP